MIYWKGMTFYWLFAYLLTGVGTIFWGWPVGFPILYSVMAHLYMWKWLEYRAELKDKA